MAAIFAPVPSTLEKKMVFLDSEKGKKEDSILRYIRGVVCEIIDCGSFHTLAI